MRLDFHLVQPYRGRWCALVSGLALVTFGRHRRRRSRATLPKFLDRSAGEATLQASMSRVGVQRPVRHRLGRTHVWVANYGNSVTELSGLDRCPGEGHQRLALRVRQPPRHRLGR